MRKLAFVILLASCTNSGTASSTASSADSGAPVIVKLKDQKHIITLSGGADGPRFTIALTDGKVLAANLTAEQLQEQHPELYQAYKSAIVADMRVPGAGRTLDARGPMPGPGNLAGTLGGLPAEPQPSGR